MKNVVVYKLFGKKEQRKPFTNFSDAFRWQGNLLKKRKKSLEYAFVE